MLFYSTLVNKNVMSWLAFRVLHLYFFACGFVVLAESIGQICRLVQLGKFPHNISFLLAYQYYFSRLATILLPQIFANFTGEKYKSKQ